MANVPAWTVRTEENRFHREYIEQRRLYENYRTIDAALNNQLLVVFDEPYLATFKNEYTEFATRSTMDLLIYIYKNYAHISPSDM